MHTDPAFPVWEAFVRMLVSWCSDLCPSCSNCREHRVLGLGVTQATAVLPQGPGHWTSWLPHMGSAYCDIKHHALCLPVQWPLSTECTVDLVGSANWDKDCRVCTRCNKYSTSPYLLPVMLLKPLSRQFLPYFSLATQKTCLETRTIFLTKCY
jgi:hypothetical protein